MTTVTERRIVREAEARPSEAIEGGEDESEGRRAEREEMTLTFRLGNVTMANSLKPNSAVSQLFPGPRFVSPPPGRSPEDETGKKSPESDEEDPLQNSLIKRTIERNTLRRSLVRYPADIRLKRAQNKRNNENSLVERIKKLTCDVDEEPERSSPTGEEAKVPAYRKITELFGKKEKELQAPASAYPYYRPIYGPPDLGNGGPKPRSSEARKQFLSTLAPLAACVSGEGGARDSTASSAGTEYSLGDIEEALKSEPQPDVVAGTDELALFVERDASRIERIRKRYASSSDDEHDDYGFNRRPSVRGIKPRFGSTTEILQQMQSQMTPPLAGSHVSWPYYAEANGYPRAHYMQRPPRQVRATQTVSYYRAPRPLVYYPRSPVPCGSPTKLKLERGAPEGASSSPALQPEPHNPMMYAMNV